MSNLDKKEPVNEPTIKCDDCQESYTLTQVRADEVRMFKDDFAVSFPSGVTQQQIDKYSFLCECCHDEQSM